MTTKQLGDFVIVNSVFPFEPY